jgi:hypothetical protein
VGVERYLNSVRHDPARLRAFLLDLPKGGRVVLVSVLPRTPRPIPLSTVPS